MTLEEQIQFYADKWGWNESELADIRELLRRKWNIALDEAKAFVAIVSGSKASEIVEMLKDE